MTDSARQHTEVEAVALLERAGVIGPPVPVERLARMLGATVRYEPFDGELSGLLYKEDGRATIGVNALHAKARQRFTIAHELGHLLLHERDDLHIDRHFRIRHRDEVSAQGTDDAEMAANAFAAALLMPADMLAADLVGQALDLEDDVAIRRLATRYRVSLQALVFRLTNLGFLR